MNSFPDFLVKHPFWFYVKRHPRAVFIGLTSLFITNFLDGIYPLLIKESIDFIEKQTPFDQTQRSIFLLCAVLVGLSFTRWGWRVGFGYFHTHAAEDIRQRLFRHITGLSPKFFNRKPVGELMSLLTNDVQSFRQAIGPGLLILADGFMIIAVILPIMLKLNWKWTFQTLIFLPVVPFLIWKVMKMIHERFKLQQDHFSEMTGIAQETIAGVRVIKGFALEDIRNRLFDKKSKQVELSSNSTARVDAFFGPVMEFGVASGSVILLFVASNDVITGAVTLGTFVAFHRYIQKMVWPMTALGLGLSMFQKGWASFDRMKEVIAESTDTPDSGTKQLTEFRSLEFRNVSFIYPSASVPSLQNVSFKINKGECIGVMGSVGAGKTTLVQLMTRLYPASSGQILINDTPIEEFTIQSLRKHLLLVPQEPFLFSDSIHENIAFGVDSQADFNEIEQITHLVDIHDEIAALPHQFESQLGERGVNLSGGQKQRLTIARGLILKSSVLILDDSLSAVDTKTEHAIETELGKNKQSTRIIVAHRLSSLKNAHKILVLKNGHVEAFASPSELATISPTYQTIVKLQSQNSDMDSNIEPLQDSSSTSESKEQT